MTTAKNDESGQAGGEVLAIGFVLLVSMILLGMNAWAVIDAKIRVAGAARFAVRTLVESPPEEIKQSAGEFTLDDGDRSVAVDAVQFALKSRPKLMSNVRVRVELTDEAFRCSRAFLNVRVHVPVFGFPRIGPMRDGFEVSATQSEIVDPFRSGLEGTSDCNA